ncbi:MAG TPA: hypothetical protein VK970_10095 [Candidatus Methylacidiphilales bacterium]|nr:hypothetical protein [Candidatus Methylacidiphilales bacterium]
MARKNILVTCLVLMAALHVPTYSQQIAQPPPQPADYKGSCDRILKKLENGKDNIGTLASRPAASAMTDPAEAMERFVVLMLAGYDQQAIAFLDVLKKHKDQVYVSGLATELKTRRRWNVLRRFLELFPEMPPEDLWGFFPAWSKTASPAVISAWLEKRIADVTPIAAKPDHRLSIYAGFARRFWVKQQFEFAGQQKQLGALVESYRRRLVADPRNDTLAVDLLDAFSSPYGTSSGTTSVEWIAELWQPTTASAAYEVGRKFEWKPAIALKLLDKALELPFAEVDRQFLIRQQRMRAMADPNRLEDDEKEFRACVRHALVKANLKLGNNAEAQKLIERIAADFPNGLPNGNLEMAGRAQVASGERVIEKRILAAEATPENQKSPEYWSQRCQYYIGRGEHEKALEAARTQLALTTIPRADDPKDDGGGDSNAWRRCMALMKVTDCLSKLDRKKEAVELLRGELAVLPPEHGSAQWVADRLMSDHWHQGAEFRLDPDDTLLWTWLEARSDWEAGARRVLSEMAGVVKSDPEKLEAFCTRVQSLSLKKPSRAIAAADIFSGLSQYDRALNCLEYCIRELPDGREKKRASYELYILYLRRKEWKQAEALLSQAMAADMFFNNLEAYMYKYQELSLCAAQAGARQDAMRFWSRARGFDRRCDSNTISEMVSAGMKPDLIAWYTALVKKEPACTAAATHLKRLTRPAGKESEEEGDEE